MIYTENRHNILYIQKGAQDKVKPFPLSHNRNTWAKYLSQTYLKIIYGIEEERNKSVYLLFLVNWIYSKFLKKKFLRS